MLGVRKNYELKITNYGFRVSIRFLDIRKLRIKNYELRVQS